MQNLSNASIVRQLDSSTLLRRKHSRPMLLESICIVCISMFPPSPINLKEKIIKKSHAYYIQVGLKTLGLTNCRTYELSDCRSNFIWHALGEILNLYRNVENVEIRSNEKRSKMFNRFDNELWTKYWNGLHRCWIGHILLFLFTGYTLSF